MLRRRSVEVLSALSLQDVYFFAGNRNEFRQEECPRGPAWEEFMKKISLVVLTLATALATASAATLDTLNSLLPVRTTVILRAQPQPCCKPMQAALSPASRWAAESLASSLRPMFRLPSMARHTLQLSCRVGGEWGSDVTTLPLAGYYTDIVDTTGASGDLPNNVDDIGGIVFQLTSAGTYVNDYVFIFNDGNGDVTYVSSISGLTD